MRHVLIAASLLAMSASVAVVAQSRYLPDSPGTWKPWKFTAYADHRRVLGARPADVKALEAQLLRLNAIIKKTDGITNPVGFSVETAGALEPEVLHPGGCTANKRLLESIDKAALLAWLQ